MFNNNVKKMKAEQISKESWLRLIKLAEKYRTEKPLEFIYEKKPVGIENPETGEIGFCAVPMHMEFIDSLAIYRGIDGLMSLLDFYSDSEISDDLFIDQKCYMLSFVNRSKLDKTDIELFNKLGIDLKNKKFLPVIRKYDPGYYPILPETEDDIQYFSQAIEQLLAIDPAETINKSNPDGKFSPVFFIRKAEKTEQGLTWHSEWIDLTDKFTSEQLMDLETVYMNDDDLLENEDDAEMWMDESDGDDDEEILNQIDKATGEHKPFEEDDSDIIFIEDIARATEFRNQIKNVQGEWYVDHFYLPFPVLDDAAQNNRPYFADVVVISDRHWEMILSSNMTHRSGLKDKLKNVLYDTIADKLQIPETVVVRKKLVYQAMKSPCRALDILLLADEDDEFFETIRFEIIDMFMQNPGQPDQEN